MADSSIGLKNGLKIGLDGEREFECAISDIGRDIWALGCELKLAASSIDGTDQSAAALTARVRVSCGRLRQQRNR